ncbi:hypothetical protein [Coraliomargarita parva]|uniref:hypothetical protein n=1 Tax=Coraliomargarita parva TaxID=3014050 RepID=UPI0022B5631C|nr:hypothetical protein [Coraliomargarita parva]
MARWSLGLCTLCLFLGELSAGLPPGRPLEACPKFSVQDVRANSDGLDSYWLELKLESLKLRWYHSSEWKIQSEHTERVSLLLVHRSDPNLRLTLSYYPSGSWLVDFSEASIAAYLQSLRDRHDESEVVVQNDGSFRPAIGSPPFLTGNYRQFIYVVKPVNPAGRSIGACDALTFTKDGGLLVFHQSGPADRLPYLEADLGATLAQFVEMD